MILNNKKIQSLKNIQNSISTKKNIDIYETGFYNGIEMALSVLEDRKASYLCTDGEPLEIDVKHEDQPKGRTIAKGEIKLGRK